jgi:hypothetical protein
LDDGQSFYVAGYGWPAPFAVSVACLAHFLSSCAVCWRYDQTNDPEDEPLGRCGSDIVDILVRRLECLNAKLRNLPTESKSLDQRAITFGVFLAEIPQQPPPATYHLEEATPRMMIVWVIAKVIGQSGDAFRQ